MSKLIYQGNSDLENNNDTLGIQEVSVKIKNKNKKISPLENLVMTFHQEQIHKFMTKFVDNLIYKYIYIYIRR